MTGSPRWIPMDRKNVAARVDISAMSAKLKEASAPFSSHQTRAGFAGAVRAILSTTSHAKLNLSGTVTEKPFAKSS